MPYGDIRVRDGVPPGMWRHGGGAWIGGGGGPPASSGNDGGGCGGVTGTPVNIMARQEGGGSSGGSGGNGGGGRYGGWVQPDLPIGPPASHGSGGGDAAGGGGGPGTPPPTPPPPPPPAPRRFALPIFAARRLSEDIDRDEGAVQEVLDAMVEAARQSLRVHGWTRFELGDGHYLSLYREETAAGSPADDEDEQDETSVEEFW